MLMILKFSFVLQTFFWFFFFRDQDQNFIMKFINISYALYTKDTPKFSVVPQSFCRNHNPIQDQDQDQDHDVTLDLNTRSTFHT